MQIGDLVCYNAAGQKYKTLGLVLDFDQKRGLSSFVDNPKLVLIQWCVISDIMPRRVWGPLGWSRDKIYSGEHVWHEIGDWFEVVNE